MAVLVVGALAVALYVLTRGPGVQPVASPEVRLERTADHPARAAAARPRSKTSLAPSLVAAPGEGGPLALSPAPTFGASGPAFRVVWRRVADLPESRARFGAAVAGGRIWVVGGESRNGVLASAVTYDPAADRWTPAGTMRAARSNHGLVAVDGRIWAIGGFNGEALLGGVEVLDPSTGSWTTVEGAGGSMPTPRSGFACAAVGGRIWTFGGDHPVIEVFDTATRRWESRGNMPSPLSAASAVVSRDLVYLIGGFGGAAASPAIRVYDTRAGRWLSDAAPMQQARAGLAVVDDAGGAVFSIGGTFRSPLSLVEVCRAPGEPWWGMDDLPAPRANLRAVIARGKLYAIGGMDRAAEVSVFEGTVTPP